MPVCFVAVHRNLHPSAAGGNHHVEVRVAQTVQKCLKRIDIVKCRGLADVATVQKNVDADPRHALFFGFRHHCLEVVNVRVDVTVRKQSEEVQGGVMVLYVGNQLFPSLGRKHFARFNGIGNQLCALRENLSRTERVVTDFAVAHIIVGGESHRRAVRFQGNHWVFFHQHIEVRGVSGLHRIGNRVGSKSDTVHHDGQNRSLDAGKAVEFFQNFVHVCSSIHKKHFHTYTIIAKKMQIAREFGKVFRKFKNGGRKGSTLTASNGKVTEQGGGNREGKRREDVDGTVRKV